MMVSLLSFLLLSLSSGILVVESEPASSLRKRDILIAWESQNRSYPFHQREDFPKFWLTIPKPWEGKWKVERNHKIFLLPVKTVYPAAWAIPREDQDLWNKALEGKAIKIPENPWRALTLGKALLNLDPDKARAFLINAWERLDERERYLAGLLIIRSYLLQAKWTQGLTWIEKIDIHAGIQLPHYFLALLYSFHGQVLYYMGKDPMDYYLKALRIWEKENPLHLETGKIHNNLGIVAYDKTDFPKAREAFAKAEKLFFLNHAENYLAILYNNLGNLASDQGQIDEALDDYQKALQLYQKSHVDPLRLSMLFQNMGVTHHQMGHLVEAEAFVKQAMDYAERAKTPPAYLAELYNNLATIREEQGKWIWAEQNYLKALDYFQGMEEKQAVIYHNLANLEMDRGELDKAHEFSQKSIDISRKYQPNTLAMVRNLVLFGAIERVRENYKNSLQALSEAMKIVKESAPSSLEEAGILHSMALAYLENSALNKAKDHLEKADAIYETSAPHHLYRSEIQFYLGKIARLKGEREKALDHFLKSRDILYQQFSLFSKEELSMLHLSKNLRKLHEALLSLTWEARKKTPSFELLEDFKGKIFSFYASRYQQWRLQALKPKEREKLMALRKRLDEIQEALQKVKGEARKALMAEKEDIMANLLSLSFMEGKAKTLQPSQPKLPPEGVGYLSLFSLPEKILVFFATHEGIFSYEVPLPQSVLHRKVRFSRKLLSFPELPENLWKRASQELYQSLFSPIEDRLPSLQHLYLSLDGSLHALPFSALWDGKHYLMEKVTLSYIYSLRDLKRHTPSPPSPPSYSLWAYGEGREEPPLMSLPYVKREVETIARLPGIVSKVWKDQEAQEEKFKANIYNASHLHLACHGTVDWKNPLQSGLWLAPSEEDNGFLQGWEILTLPLPPLSLVVLSACETALGKSYGGEGLMGLTRPFLQKGVQNVIATLWPIQDEVTAAFMKDFYTHLGKGAPPCKALRETQEAFAARYHPFYWASFTCFGP